MELRLYHRRRRLRRLRSGQPAVGPQRQQGAAAGGRAGHAARQGARGDPRFLSRHRVSRTRAYTGSALKVTTEVIPHNRPHETTTDAAHVRAGARAGRRFVDQRPARQSRRADRLRRVGTRAARTGWNWDNVLPFFKKVERDMDFDGPWHGNEGRIPVRRIFPDLWPEHAKAAGRNIQGRPATIS